MSANGKEFQRDKFVILDVGYFSFRCGGMLSSRPRCDVPTALWHRLERTHTNRLPTGPRLEPCDGNAGLHGGLLMTKRKKRTVGYVVIWKDCLLNKRMVRAGIGPAWVYSSRIEASRAIKMDVKTGGSKWEEVDYRIIRLETADGDV